VRGGAPRLAQIDPRFRGTSSALLDGACWRLRRAGGILERRLAEVRGEVADNSPCCDNCSPALRGSALPTSSEGRLPFVPWGHARRRVTRAEGRKVLIPVRRFSTVGHRGAANDGAAARSAHRRCRSGATARRSADLHPRRGLRQREAQETFISEEGSVRLHSRERT
jgi:hypothetical protein